MPSRFGSHAFVQELCEREAKVNGDYAHASACVGGGEPGAGELERGVGRAARKMRDSGEFAAEKSLIIVIPTCNNHNLSIVHRIDEPVGFINPPRPITTQIFAQRFGFADTGKRFSKRCFDEQIDSA